MLLEPIDSSCCTSKLRGEVPIEHLHWPSLFVLVRCREDLTLGGAGGRRRPRGSALAEPGSCGRAVTGCPLVLEPGCKVRQEVSSA